MVEAMQERKIDMAFRIPQSLEKAVSGRQPDIVISMDPAAAAATGPETENEIWILPEIEEKDLNSVRRVRDEIEAKVKALIDRL